MKKKLSIVIILCVMLLNMPTYANDEAVSEYDANENYGQSTPLGYGSSSAANSTISMSMVGWGLGLAIVIAAVASIVHQSAAIHSHSSDIKPNSSL